VRERAGRIGLALALAALASPLLAPSPPTQKEMWERSLAQVDEALEANPSGVSQESLKSCRSTRKTAVLLYKMGHHARAFRRLEYCRMLLRIDWIDWEQSGGARPAGDSWFS
jgi:hypothetical protein